MTQPTKIERIKVKLTFELELEGDPVVHENRAVEAAEAAMCQLFDIKGKYVIKPGTHYEIVYNP